MLWPAEVFLVLHDTTLTRVMVPLALVVVAGAQVRAGAVATCGGETARRVLPDEWVLLVLWPAKVFLVLPETTLPQVMVPLALVVVGAPPTS